jgi:hypothetical protein
MKRMRFVLFLSIQYQILLAKQEGKTTGAATTTTSTRDSDMASIRHMKQAQSHLAKEEVRLTTQSSIAEPIVKEKRKKSSKAARAIDLANGFDPGKEDHSSYQGLRYYYMLPNSNMGQDSSSSSLHLVRWHVPITAEGREDMKEHLRFWARAVASMVR